MNKQATWIIVLVTLTLILAACGGADTAVEPGVTPNPEGALEPASDSPDTTSDDDAPYPAEEERPIEDPTVIEAEDELELVPIPEEAMPESVIPENSPAVLNDIVADVFERSGSKSATVNVVKMEETVWRDGSLGCPQPGMMYTQALVDGYWIILEVDGVEYDYRATQNGTFRLCETPTK